MGLTNKKLFSMGHIRRNWVWDYEDNWDDDGNFGDDDGAELVKLITKYVNTKQQLEWGVEL